MRRPAGIRSNSVVFHVLESRLLLAADPAGLGEDPVEPVVEPVAINELVVPAEANENDSIDLAGTLVSPLTEPASIVINWGDGSDVTVVAMQAGDSQFAASHVYLDDNPTGTPADMYFITAAVEGNDPGVGSAIATIAVSNLAPTITQLLSSAVSVGSVAQGETVTISGLFTDVGTLDTHTAVIDWGDGTTSAATIIEADGAGSIAGEHVYAEGGIYTISVTLADDDAGSASAGAVAVVSGMSLRDGVLQLIGTTGSDRVLITESPGSATLKVRASFIAGGTTTFDLADVQRIEILLGDGNDRAMLAGGRDIAALIDGGAGNDKLKAGAGRSVLLGSDGNDMLMGGQGPSVMIGGLGNDRLVGGPGDDLLIGGRTTFDIDDDAITADWGQALRAIGDEWSSPNTFEQRVANLDGSGAGDGLNGDYYLDADMTVLDTVAGDKLTGSSGQNWYFGPATGKKVGRQTVDLFSDVTVPQTKPGKAAMNQHKGKNK